MAVEIKRVGFDEDNNSIFVATDLATNEEVKVKNWYEKSKDKWHIVLGPNSANRKYIAHNEFEQKNQDDVYIVEDKTTPSRVLGTAQPDKHLIPYMTAEDKEEYDRIIGRALENKAAQSKKPESEEEKLEKQIARLRLKLAQYKTDAEQK